ASEHIDIRPEGMEGIAAAVHGNKTMARLHPINKSLFVGEWQVAGRIGKNDGVVIFQILRTEPGERLSGLCIQLVMCFLDAGVVYWRALGHGVLVFLEIGVVL